jgi:metallo-beta-lactamase class B
VIEPQKIFDNVYFVGQNAVSSYAVKTSAGIVIFDTLNSADEAKKYIVDGLVKLGLDPHDIKYVVITHAHGDHYNGAQYLKDTYGARLISSEADWEVMDRTRTQSSASGQPAGWRGPTHDATDLTVGEGQKWTFGDTTFTFHITPAHTPGTISTIFPTTDNGFPHVIGFYGGLGTPATAADKKLHIEQLERFIPIARMERVDVLLANHQTQDQAIWKIEELRLRRPGDRNPYVMGTDAYVRYLQLQQACTEFAMAQQGQR